MIVTSLRNFVFVSFLVGLVSCSSRTQKPNDGNRTADKEKILIVYLTRTGNTEAVAKMLQEKVGGDLVSLELEDPYPKNYQAIVRQVDGENDRNFLPPLKTKIKNIGEYQTIFLGFPTWDMQLPPPMKSFLSQYNLTGKTVIPFNTNAGYGVGRGFDQVNQLCRNCKILEGFEIKGGIERDGILFVMEGEKELEARTQVEEWLQRIGIIDQEKRRLKLLKKITK